MKSGKIDQSRISLKDDAIQLEPTKNAKTFKDLYFDLAGNLVRKLPAALDKSNNSTKH